jgi:hypothetical protein
MITDFRAISSINIDDDSSWENAIFITFDIDWASDNVLNDTIDLVEATGIAASGFVTHDTPVLDRLYSNPKFELGIHPNFNFLLEGDDRNGRNACEVIERIQTIVPEATSLRSHSMAQSTVLLDLFLQMGLTHDVNHFIPAQTGIDLMPWKLWNGLNRIPYNWEDGVHCMYGLENEMSTFVNRPGLKVFNFHPIHVFLNTESYNRYNRTRPWHQNPEELIKHRYKGYGTRSRILDLMNMAKTR